MEAADLILRALGELDAIEARVNSECDARCRSIRADFNGRLFIDGEDGERIAIADARQKLLADLESFCETHRAELLAETGKKSRELNHGTIGWRARPKSLAPTVNEDGELGPNAGSATVLEAAYQHLCRALNAHKLFRKVSETLRFFKVQVSFDRAALLKAAENEEISEAELKKCGFVIAGGGDQFYVKPKAAELASQPSTAPQGAD